MKVLVCGSRNWFDRGPIERELRKLPPGTIIVHGAAPGADSLADSVARCLGFEVRVYPAEWATHGRAAGPIRNSEMLTKEHRSDEPIDLVLAFAKDFSLARGTSDMMRKAREAGVHVEPFSF
jgi:hypothetical protein